MLFKTKINGQDGYIYILMEHKSYIEGKVGKG
ncbi:Rpn family recombination-promoting nuclease/putative transposase [Petrotoga miotherma]